MNFAHEVKKEFLSEYEMSAKIGVIMKMLSLPFLSANLSYFLRTLLPPFLVIKAYKISRTLSLIHSTTWRSQTPKTFD